MIVSDLPGLADIVRHYEIGTVVKSTEQIPAAIDQIFDNYRLFSENAIKVFDEDLNMDVFLHKVYKEIVW